MPPVSSGEGVGWASWAREGVRGLPQHAAPVQLIVWPRLGVLFITLQSYCDCMFF